MGKLRVYVRKDQIPDTKVDGKYHNYFVVQENSKIVVEHREEYIPSETTLRKGTYRRCGDYAVVQGFFNDFNLENCKEVQLCECSPCAIFEEYGLVGTLPNHSDHYKGGFEEPYKFVVNQRD